MTETVKPDTLPILRAQDRLARARDTVKAICLAAESIGTAFERSAIAELASTALRRIEKVERRLQAYRDRVNGGAA